jgi:hypothetical protein
VVAEVALSLLLLIAAGLFVRSLQSARAIDPGFEAAKLVSAPLSVNLLRYTRQQGREFYRQVVEQVEHVPGVESASVARVAVLGGTGRVLSIHVEGRGAAHEQVMSEGGRIVTGDRTIVNANVVGPRFFRTIGVPIVAGRDFGDQDVEGRASGGHHQRDGREHAFRRRKPDRQARQRRGTRRSVARDRRHGAGQQVRRARRRRCAGGVSAACAESRDGDDAVRARLGAAGLAGVEHSPGDSAARTESAGAEHSDRSPRRLGRLYTPHAWARGCSPCSAAWRCCWLPSASTACSRFPFPAARARWAFVSRSARASTKVFLLVVRDGMVLVAIGIALGLTAGLAGTRSLASFLYGVSTFDVLTFMVTVAILAAVAFAACAIPARRAMRVHPIAALRQE